MGLLAGLSKHYQSDFNQTWWRDEAWEEAIKCMRMQIQGLIKDLFLHILLLCIMTNK